MKGFTFEYLQSLEKVGDLQKLKALELPEFILPEKDSFAIPEMFSGRFSGEVSVTTSFPSSENYAEDLIEEINLE